MRTFGADTLLQQNWAVLVVTILYRINEHLKFLVLSSMFPASARTSLAATMHPKEMVSPKSIDGDIRLDWEVDRMMSGRTLGPR